MNGTDSSPTIVLGCWERILKEARGSKNLDHAFAAVKAYFTAHPHELKPDRYGRISRSIKKKCPSRLTDLVRKITRKRCSQREKDFKEVYRALTRNWSGHPAIENSHVVFYHERQLQARKQWRSDWGKAWQEALLCYFTQKPNDLKTAFYKKGLILGYQVDGNIEQKKITVPFLGIKQRDNFRIKDLTLKVSGASGELEIFLHGVFAEIKSSLQDSEAYLIQYKTRNVASALATSVMFSAPFVVLGYVADFFLLPALAATGLSKYVWKFFEIIIRYVQGCLDTVIQFFTIRRDYLEKGVGVDEYKAAKSGLYGSLLGPIAALLAPVFALAETSRWYALVAILNANADNVASTVRKAGTNWGDAKALKLRAGAMLKHIFSDTYVLGNLIGSASIFFIDLGGRFLLQPSLFEFLRIVALEGLIIGMLDSEITALASKGMVEYQNRKWQKLINANTLRKVFQRHEMNGKPASASSTCASNEKTAPARG